MGPPSDARGNTDDRDVRRRLRDGDDREWVCEHRDPHIRSMVGFRSVVAGTAITHWWDNERDAIAFSRGDRGFVAINRESAAVAATVATGLASGMYCDRLTGGLLGGTCGGVEVAVGPTGTVDLRLEPNTAIAIDVTTRR